MIACCSRCKEKKEVHKVYTFVLCKQCWEASPKSIQKLYPVWQKLKKGGAQMKCSVCGQPIKDDEHCYQLRYGYVEGDDFFTEEDIAYCHEDCLPWTVEDQKSVSVKETFR